MQSNIKVGIVGAGAMGRAIAFQVSNHPEMELVWVADQALSAAQGATKLAKSGTASDDCLSMLQERPVDVLVEATNSIEAAATHCFAAIEANAHVVLMNAEVDLALRPLLDHKAKETGVTVTSDAGDQHGVLAAMIDLRMQRASCGPIDVRFSDDDFDRILETSGGNPREADVLCHQILADYVSLR